MYIFIDLQCSPPVLEDGVVQKSLLGRSYYSNGDIVNFECSVGFNVLDGETTIMCQKDGTWTRNPLKCQSKYNKNVYILILI